MSRADAPQAGSSEARHRTGESRPGVAVIMAAFLSHRTLGRSLQALSAQTRPADEVVIVDSSPDERTAAVVEGFPEVRLIRSRDRLLPQVARMRGVATTRCELLLFADPDVYPEPDWLERLVSLWRERRPAMVAAALGCWDRDWLNRGIHVCKFARWLPGGSVRPVDNVPSASLLIARALFDDLGGFQDPFFGDAQLSRQAARRGELLLEPAAVAWHDHGTTLRAFVRERFTRGRGLPQLDAGAECSRGGDAMRLAMTALPVRFAHSLAKTFQDCRRGPGVAAWASALPIVALGHAATMAGESVGLARRLLGRR
ncbi:MAG TPA: glycosyltransferase [Thermoanaerobaculia bacterium]|nr:glycosyltransferase [Thermoanaerobaculia bacterium]